VEAEQLGGIEIDDQLVLGRRARRFAADRLAAVFLLVPIMLRCGSPLMAQSDMVRCRTILVETRQSQSQHLLYEQMSSRP
jgi:hypothetical protein